MLKVILLAGGKGQRFKDAGYKDFKPFIKIKGQYMVDLVSYNVDIPNTPSNPHILAVKENEITIENFKDLHKKYRIIEASSELGSSKGSAIAVSNIVRGFVDSEDEILIVDCDQIVEPGSIKRAVRHFRDKKMDAGVIATYDQSHTDWTHITTVDDKVMHLYPKDTCDASSLADVGILYFKEARQLFKHLNFIIFGSAILNETDGEVRHESVINSFIEEEKYVGYYIVNEFHNIGTPEYLDEYLKYIS